MNDQSFFFLMQNAANTDTASTVSGRAVPASPVLGEEADFAVVEAVFEAVVDAAVVRVQLHRHRDVGIQGLEALDGLLVDLRLGLVGIVLRPEGDLVVPGGIEGLRHLEPGPAPAAVAPGQTEGQEDEDQRDGKVPPNWKLRIGN